MKQYNWIIVATISIMAMTLNSCNKDIPLHEIEQESAGTISVSVDGIMGEYVQGNDTKSELVSTTRVKWSANDKVYVYDGANYLGALTVSLKDGKDYYAVLTGENITVPQEGTTKLTLVHSNAFASNPEINNGKVSLDLSSQEGSTSPKDIPFVAFATLDFTSGTPEINGQIADFSLATSLMRLNCSGLEISTSISGAKLIGMSNECVLNITEDGISIDQGNMGDINISITDVSANAKGTQTLYVAVPKNGTATAQELEIYQSKTYTYSFGIKARETSKAYNAICPMVAKFDPSSDGYVDLGLSVLWATCNIGADAPEETGDYFAWGETTGYYGKNSGNDHMFNWENYKWCNGSSESLTKYYDSKVTLDPEDDPAHVKWGSSWRMPTKDELNELINNCTWEKTTQKGVSGYKVISKTNGNSIFLPAADHHLDGDITNSDFCGYYWSSSLYQPDAKAAYSIRFDSNDTKIGYDVRCAGQCIRAVCPSKRNEYVDLGLSVKWAACNIGADTPEEYGDYFAWGETTGYYGKNSGHNRIFNYDNYKWSDGLHGNIGYYSKYCTRDLWASEDKIDYKVTLDLEDDAAHVNLGESWRMPTKDELDELLNNCTWDWINQKGVNGYKVTSKTNGNSIFLPANGYRTDNTIFNLGTFGNYWSSSLYSDRHYEAYHLLFYSDNKFRTYTDRILGQGIRAVYVEN